MHKTSKRITLEASAKPFSSFVLLLPLFFFSSTQTLSLFASRNRVVPRRRKKTQSSFQSSSCFKNQSSINACHSSFHYSCPLCTCCLPKVKTFPSFFLMLRRPLACLGRLPKLPLEAWLIINQFSLQSSLVKTKVGQ